MLNSPLFLSLASVFSLIGLGLVCFAISTDNWTEIDVNRKEILNAFKREPELSLRLQNAFNHNFLFFSRNVGIFNLCFPNTVPQDIGSFNKMGSPCIWNNEFMVPESKKEHFTTNETYRHYAAEGTIVAYVLGIVFVVFSFIVGLFGCWNRSKRCIMVTGILLMIAGLFMSLAMLMWHYVAYAERYTLDMEPYYRSWEPVSFRPVPMHPLGPRKC
uniref:Uncharacterized protein n=1 Tax=Caenorhabditis japonica TaxID=281687 RepID=A0A8R1DXL0_CAEJA